MRPRSADAELDVGPLPIVDLATSDLATSRHRLIWASSGSALLRLAAFPIVVGPRRGAWVPCGQRITGDSTAELIHASFDAGTWAGLPVEPRAVPLDELLVASLLHLADRSEGERAAVLQSVIADRLAAAFAESTFGPSYPVDPAARRVAEAVASDPSDRRSLGAWAREVAASERTLRRRFVQETGLTFTDWSGASRMQHARSLLDAGLARAVVARRCGYRTTKALTIALRSDRETSSCAETPATPEAVGDPQRVSGRAGAVSSPTRPRRRTTKVVTDALARTVSVPVAPTRVVAMAQFTLGDPLLAIDAPLVGMAMDEDSSTWHPPLAAAYDLSDIVRVGTENRPDITTLRELEPDLIVAYSFRGEPLEGVDIEQLQRIAPTVTFDEARPRDVHLDELAALVDRAEALDRQRRSYLRAVRRITADVPEHVRNEIVTPVMILGGRMWSLTNTNPSPIECALRDLGLRRPRFIQDDELYIRLDVEQQRASPDEPDVLLVESRSDASVVKGWDELRAVARRRVFDIDTPAGVSYPSGEAALDALECVLTQLADAA
ncbi:MAG: ABC transporter substrate-binding protein [Actinomycetota bacterium]